MGNSAQRFLYSRFGHHYAHTSRSGPYVYEMVDDEQRLRAEGPCSPPTSSSALGTAHDARFQGHPRRRFSAEHVRFPVRALTISR